MICCHIREINHIPVAVKPALLNSMNHILMQQIVGALWYLFAIERKDACWIWACKETQPCNISNLYCAREVTNSDAWRNFTDVFIEPKCAVTDEDKGNSLFKYGIYAQALSSGVLDSEKFISKYFYCLWWGLQNLRYYFSNYDDVFFIIIIINCE